MYRELQRDMGPYRTVHIALHMFTHVLQVNMCFLYVQTRRIQILHCYICQVLLYDKYSIYWVQGNITRLVPHCESCQPHAWQNWQHNSDIYVYTVNVSSSLFDQWVVYAMKVTYSHKNGQNANLKVQVCQSISSWVNTPWPSLAAG